MSFKLINVIKQLRKPEIVTNTCLYMLVMTKYVHFLGLPPDFF